MTYRGQGGASTPLQEGTNDTFFGTEKSDFVAYSCPKSNNYIGLCLVLSIFVDLGEF